MAQIRGILENRATGKIQRQFSCKVKQGHRVRGSGVLKIRKSLHGSPWLCFFPVPTPCFPLFYHVLCWLTLPSVQCGRCQLLFQHDDFSALIAKIRDNKPQCSRWRKPQSQQGEWTGWISVRHLVKSVVTARAGHVPGCVGLYFLVAFSEQVF